MKILVVFTGGTIGSTRGKYIAPDGKKQYVLIEAFRERTGKDVEFEYLTPYTILSENLTGENIRVLGNCILENLGKGYEGIIVTHGTDTLQYGAAAIAYVGGKADIPIMFVSSNYVLEDERANGVDNFCKAEDFIENHRGKGVFVSYRNLDGKVYIHRGTRVLPHLPYSDEVFSVSGQYYGVYDGEIYQENTAYKRVAEGQRLQLPRNETSAVMRVVPYPGMVYPELKSGVKAVLLDSYHSGTLCSISKELEAFLQRASNLSIPVFLTGAVAGVDYESVRVWENGRIMVLPQASNIAMYVKLWLLTDNEEMNPKELYERMKQCVAEDFDGL